MICPKCGKDVGDYKYCPDCAISTIQVANPDTQSSMEPQAMAVNPDVKEKKKIFAINRFFAVTVTLQAVGCLLLAVLFGWFYENQGAGIIKQSCMILNIVAIMQTIISFACLAFSKYIKFWMMIPYTVTGCLLDLSIVLVNIITEEDCVSFLLWPILFLIFISAILAPISKIPHKEDA